jgi:hypothetical protein
MDTVRAIESVRFGRPRLINEQLEAAARALKANGLVTPEIARRITKVAAPDILSPSAGAIGAQRQWLLRATAHHEVER